MTTPVKQHTASLRGLELCAYKEDRDLRCLPSLRSLFLSRVQLNRKQVYRLPAGLVYLAVSCAYNAHALSIPSAGAVYLDASSCNKDLLILADHRICFEFWGRTGAK